MVSLGRWRVFNDFLGPPTVKICFINLPEGGRCLAQPDQGRVKRSVTPLWVGMHRPVGVRGKVCRPGERQVYDEARAENGSAHFRPCHDFLAFKTKARDVSSRCQKRSVDLDGECRTVTVRFILLAGPYRSFIGAKWRELSHGFIVNRAPVAATHVQ